MLKVRMILIFFVKQYGKDIGRRVRSRVLVVKVCKGYVKVMYSTKQVPSYVLNRNTFF